MPRVMESRPRLGRHTVRFPGQICVGSMLTFQAGPFGNCGTLAVLALRTFGVALVGRLSFLALDLSSARKICAPNRCRFPGKLPGEATPDPAGRKWKQSTQIAISAYTRPREVATGVLLRGESKQGMTRWRT